MVKMFRSSRSQEEAIAFLAKTPGSIGIITLAESINKKNIRILPVAGDSNSTPLFPCADEKCTAVNKNLINKNYYPQKLKDRFYVVIKLDGSSDEPGIAYTNMMLSDEGQKMI